MAQPRSLRWCRLRFRWSSADLVPHELAGCGFDFLIVLWMVNLYNFMDGIDGIAASQCVLYCAGVLLIGVPAAEVAELLWSCSDRPSGSCGSTVHRRGFSG